MFEIKLKSRQAYILDSPNSSPSIKRVTINTQKWVKDGNEYIIVHQEGFYNIYWRKLIQGFEAKWSDLLPHPVNDLLSIRCAIEELGIMPEEEVL